MKPAAPPAAASDPETLKEQATAVDATVTEANHTQPSYEPISEREEIAKLAYSFWLERGGRHGSPEEDWLRAEQEFQRRREGSSS